MYNGCGTATVSTVSWRFQMGIRSNKAVVCREKDNASLIGQNFAGKQTGRINVLSSPSSFSIRTSKCQIFLLLFFFFSRLCMCLSSHFTFKLQKLTAYVFCRLHRIISIVNVLIRVSYQSHGFHNLADDLKSSIP